MPETVTIVVRRWSAQPDGETVKQSEIIQMPADAPIRDLLAHVVRSIGVQYSYPFGADIEIPFQEGCRDWRQEV